MQRFFKVVRNARISLLKTVKNTKILQSGEKYEDFSKW
jgi:hypothetical protein